VTIPVRLHAVADVPRTQVEAARSEMESLDRYAGGRLMDARLTLHRGTPRAKRPYVADASVLLDGRKLAAHAAGATPRDAADSVVDRLRRQVRRVVDAEVAQRNEPAAIEAALEALPEPDRRHRPEVRLKPPEEREIVKRRTYAPGPETTFEAIEDMIDLDEEFHLFVHARTGEDVVLYRRDDGRIGLIHPRGSALADENDVVVPEPSRYSEPLTLERARTEMDFLNHRFLYFVDADDGRGKAIYLRHDGDYGLVVPE
jgi:ribosome-associated translation inhibitor RaiA